MQADEMSAEGAACVLQGACFSWCFEESVSMKQRVLIVEDNELNREILRELLSDEYKTLEAENGQEALDILRQGKERVSLILLDVMMPVMDGYTFLRIIRKDPELSLIPVIVTTQGDSEADEIAALENGATDFVAKPYQPEIIRHRVASLIRLRETAAMANQFMYDRLTGLYAKEYFYEKVRQVLEDDPENEYAILCCNLVNFKLYNDTFGRAEGDRLLKAEARLVREKVGAATICCRYAADRFLCLIDSKTGSAVVEHFSSAESSNRSDVLNGMSVKFGIYLIRDLAVSVEQMCDRVLLAVDTIKNRYDQHVAVYDDTLRDRLLREQAITDSMEQALSEMQFTVYYQPKYRLADGVMVGAEALVRWVNPELGFMSPGEFIPLFEKNGFIRRLDAYIWERVCETLRDWNAAGYELVPVSVNVSRADIYQSHLADSFCRLVETYGISPQLLHLEITESAYTDQPEQIISAVAELRRRGFVIEMDDFGSGYSSLNMLGQMSLDILKLDMQFLRNEMEKPLERSLIQDVVTMAHRMHLNVVAEGIETEEQKERLQAMGCDYAQGYFFAKPMSAEEFEVLLKKRQV